jgi:hypothetical protein
MPLCSIKPTSSSRRSCIQDLAQLAVVAAIDRTFQTMPGVCSRNACPQFAIMISVPYLQVCLKILPSPSAYPIGNRNVWEMPRPLSIHLAHHGSVLENFWNSRRKLEAPAAPERSNSRASAVAERKLNAITIEVISGDPAELHRGWGPLTQCSCSRQGASLQHLRRKRYHLPCLSQQLRFYSTASRTALYVLQSVRREGSVQIFKQRESVSYKEFYLHLQLTFSSSKISFVTQEL